MSRWFVSDRMALAYAQDRPAVHPEIVRLVRTSNLAIPQPRLALDVGCGAGLSTRALRNWVDRVIGVDPSVAMLRHAGTGGYAAAAAEALPFREACFDLVTAAGSLNWSDLEIVLPEIRRVIQPRGQFLLYDFGPGQLDEPASAWHEQFAAKYPFPPARRLHPESIKADPHRLELIQWRPFEIDLPSSRDAYLRYALSETNVEAALGRGESLSEIQAWCSGQLELLLPEGEIAVRYQGYWVLYSAR